MTVATTGSRVRGRRFLAAALALTSCAPLGGPVTGTDTRVEFVRYPCPDLERDARLDAIRLKAPILFSAALEITVAQRNDPSYPSAEEREATAVWNTLAQSCEQGAVQRAGPQPDFLVQSWLTEEELRLRLADGRFTYGEFRRARWDLLDRRKAGMEQMMRTWGAVPDRSTLAYYHRLPWWEGGQPPGTATWMPIVIMLATRR